MNGKMPDRFPNHNAIYGEPIWYEKDGKFYNCKTHEEMNIVVKTLTELLELIKQNR